MAKLLPPPKFRYFKPTNNAPASGWLVNTYEPGTVVRKTTYTTYLADVANANPTVLDADGEADIWWNGNYKVVITDEAGGNSKTIDNYGRGDEASTSGQFNLVANQSFEQAEAVPTEPDDWTITNYTGGAHTLDTTDPVHGATALKFTSTGTGGGYADSSFFEVQGSVKHTVRWSMRSTVADVRNDVQLVYYTAAKVEISIESLYSNSTTNPTGWTITSVTSAVSPSTARFAKIRLIGCNSSDVTPGSTFFDNITVTDVFASNIVYSGNNTFSGTNTFLEAVMTTPTVSGGTGAAFTGTIGAQSYVANTQYELNHHTDNTGAYTVNFNNLGAINVKLTGATDPIAGDAKTGRVSRYLYDGTNMVLQNPYLSIPNGSVIGAGSTGTNLADLYLDGGSGTAGGAFAVFRKNSVTKGRIGNESAISGGTSDSFLINTATGVAVKILPDGASVIISVVATAGTANAGTATLGETAYTTDRIYEAKITTSNTGACTMAFDGLAARSVKLIDGTDPLAGQQQAGMVAKWLCTATTLVLLNPFNPSGTWTPNLWDTSNSSAESQTYFSQSGKYRTSGDQVFIHGSMNINSLGTLTTTSVARIGPLPFTAAGDGEVYFGAATSLSVTAGVALAGHITSTLDYIELYMWDSAAGTSAALISNVSAGGDLRFSGSYFR